MRPTKDFAESPGAGERNANGTITNLYVTPVTRLEFLLGKQLPYIAVSMINFAILLIMAVFVLMCR